MCDRGGCCCARAAQLEREIAELKRRLTSVEMAAKGRPRLSEDDLEDIAALAILSRAERKLRRLSRR